MGVPLVTMHGITKFIYGRDGKALRNTDVKILDDVDFQLDSGEVHVLVGENGAGKSTLMKILGGIIPPDQGRLILGTEQVLLANPREARERGIAFIHQELNLCPNLDIAHNIFLGREPHKYGVKDTESMKRKSRELLASLSCDIDPASMVAHLSTAQQQIVEIAKALSFESRVVIMDEPTASLTTREIDVLFSLIRKMQSQGMGIIYISHRFEEFLEIGDRLSVLRDGKSVGTLAMSDFDSDQVVKMMAGRSINSMYQRNHQCEDELVLEVKGLCLTSKTVEINLKVRKGEVVGIGGLVGSGRTELAKSIFGARDFFQGEVVFLGENVTGNAPDKLVKAGMALLSEDRKTEGLVLGMNIRENISLASLGDISRFGLVSGLSDKSLAARFIRELSILARSPEQIVATLSGGNQQKCVLAKWVATTPKLLILDEPTRGIDVGAKAQIHKLIDEIAASGVAILAISSELPELLGISDRIYIMREGSVVTEVESGPNFTQEWIVEQIFGTA